MTWRATRTVGLIVVSAFALAACPDDGGSDLPPGEALPPGVFIDEPARDEVIVRQASFEIGGGFTGSVTDISVSIDGALVGDATRGDPGRWRVVENRVSVTPGLHEITVTATGEGGTAIDSLWVWYETDPATTFRVALVPDAATYLEGERTASDPQLLLFSPSAGEEILLDMTVVAPPEVTAFTNPRLATGSLADLDVDVDEAPPGTYPIVVRAVSDAGETQEATHTVTITGPPPTTEPPVAPPTTESPGDAIVKVLVDDFEGADLWTSEVTASTNGSQATAELAGGGNPGTQRRTTHVLPGTDDGENNSTRITVRHLFTGGGWDPATDGALATIDYAEDQIQFEPPFDGAAVGALFVVVQGEATYTTSIIENNAFSDTSWQTVRVEGLTPADFSPAPGPDFSAAGEPMTFGYLRSNTNRSDDGIVTQHGLDNWTVHLFGATP